MEEDNRNIEETKIDSLEGNTDGTTPVEVESTLPVVESTPIAEQTTEQVVESTPPVVESTTSNEDLVEKEEPIQKKKKQPILLIVIIIIFMLFTFGLGVYFGKEIFIDKTNNKKESTNTETNTNTEVENNNNENTNTIEDNTNNEKSVDNQNLVFDDNAKNKINEFMKVAMYSNDMGEGFPWKFVEGLNGLTKEQKEELTYTATAIMDNMTELTQETVPAKYKNAKLFNDMPSRKIYELPLQIYANKYKEFFNEEFVESGDYRIAGCPYVFKIDRELGKMFLSNQCGGTSDGELDYLYLNYQYETDKDYYYVYQYNGEYMYNYNEDHIDFKRVKSDEVVFTMPRTVGERVDTNKLKEQFELNASKFEKIKWTFDKNLVFVSTENLG